MFGEIPFDACGETTASLPALELLRESGRSVVPRTLDFLEAGLGTIVSAREDGRRSEKL